MHQAQHFKFNHGKIGYDAESLSPENSFLRTTHADCMIDDPRLLQVDVTLKCACIMRLPCHPRDPSNAGSGAAWPPVGAYECAAHVTRPRCAPPAGPVPASLIQSHVTVCTAIYRWHAAADRAGQPVSKQCSLLWHFSLLTNSDPFGSPIDGSKLRIDKLRGHDPRAGLVK